MNTFGRLGSEFLTEWDEALYATSATEMIDRGDWVDVTFWGARDYYNSKPPLNVWLIAGSFAVFGQTIFALRLPSAAAALLTVVVIIFWGRRHLGARTALVAGAILATSYGFLYVHSGRTANTDALFTLFITLIVMALVESKAVANRIVWCGPLLAAIFLLRGMALLMPAVIILAVALIRRDVVTRARYYAAMIALAVIPIVFWAAARWQVDGPLFFAALIRNDLIGVTTEVLDNHAGGWFFYLRVLLKYQYDWVAAGLMSFALLRRYQPLSPHLRSVLLPWGLVAIAIPTAMATKTTWYLNPFYPFAAIVLAVVIAPACEWPSTGPRRSQVAALAVVIVSLITAESRLVWRSVRHRDISRSVQGAVLAHADAIEHRRVFKTQWDHADRFVVEKMAGGVTVVSDTLADAIASSASGDFVVWHDEIEHPELELVGHSRHQFLYRRTGR